MANPPSIAHLLEVWNGKLPAFAFPGDYPIVYVDGYHNDVCPDCAQELLGDEYGQAPTYWYIHQEGASVFCAECNAEIESAYGGPDEEES